MTTVKSCCDWILNEKPSVDDAIKASKALTRKIKTKKESGLNTDNLQNCHDFLNKVIKKSQEKNLSIFESKSLISSQSPNNNINKYENSERENENEEIKQLHGQQKKNAFNNLKNKFGVKNLEKQ